MEAHFAVVTHKYKFDPMSEETAEQRQARLLKLLRTKINERLEGGPQALNRVFLKFDSWGSSIRI